MKTSTSSLSFRCPLGSPSFALISVLALVSLAALTATAFLASARLERTATRPLGEKVRLEMALNIGFNCAKEIINSSMGSSYDTVATYWRTNPADDVGYLLSGYPRNLAGSTTPTPQMYWYAAFSTARMTELATNAPPSAVMTNRVTVDNQSMFSNTISTFMAGLTNFGANGSTNLELIGHTLANPRLSPPVGWMTIKQPVRTTPGKTNTTPTPVMRIAFFTEDLSGLIDAERMCGSTSRDTGTNPTEISMANIGPTPGITFGTATNTRATYLTPSLLASNGPIATTNLRYFATGLRSWTNAVQRVPRAIAIATGTCYGRAKGDPTVTNGAKFLIPTNPTASDVAKIAAVLTTNLPDFTNRAGGFCIASGGSATNTAAYTGDAYIQTLAANIVDYIDADSAPTTDGTALTTNRVRPVYRGVDSYPFVNEINKRYVLISTNAANINGTNGIAFTVSTTDSLELWNLSSQTSPAGTLRYVAVHGQPGTLGFQSINFTNPVWASNSSGAVLGGCSTNNLTVGAISPNCFATLDCATVTNLFFYPSTNSAVFSLTQEFTNSRYFVAWNGVYYDAALGGIRRNSGNLTLGNPANRANLPSFIYATSAGAFTNPAVGDPRATIYLSQVQDFNAYVGNATFGGRNVRAGSVSATMEYYEVTPNRWPDGGHSSPKGSSPTSDSQIPTSFAPINTNLPPGRISNKGSLSNICELGGVFDPIQWGDPSLGVWQGKWTNLSISASKNNTFGGGTSLRIGRPEHPCFAFTNLGSATDLPIPNMGQSAAALLDIFCTTNAIDDGGKININTASGPVLAALAGGISLKSDLAKVGAEINTTMVAAFTNGVMKFRQTYPFYSTSQLPFISTNYGSANWTNAWQASTVFSTNTGCGLNGISELNDQGMEEWFSKIYGLSTVQSRNFRIYVYAQMVNSNNVPYGRIMRKYYHLYTEQTAEGPNDIYNDAGYSMIPERESEY